MKKLISLFAAALVGVTAFAQVGITVGGSFGFTYSSLKNDCLKAADGASFKFVPEVGYEIMDKLTVGASLGYIHGYSALGSFSMTDFKGLGNTVVGTLSDLYLSTDVGGPLNGFVFAPFVRYTLLETKWINLFVEGGPSYTVAVKKSTSIDEDTEKSVVSRDKFHVFEFVGRPGIALNLGKQFKITAKIGSIGWQSAVSVSGQKGGEKSVMTINRIGLDVDSNNILLGMSYKF